MPDPSSTPRPKRILVVEDNNELRTLVERALASQGYQVTAAVDGDKGLAELRTSRFDLLITDLIMPGSEGIEVILEAKASAPGMKIIAMSGGSLRGGHDYLPLAGTLGAAAILRKPFGLGEMLEAVERTLDSGPVVRAAH